MSNLLQEVECQVLVEENGLDALETIKSESDIKLIFCDLNMPKMGGLELLQKIREIEIKTPFVLLTTESNQEYINRAQELDASGYLIKPPTLEHVKIMIKQFFAA